MNQAFNQNINQVPSRDFNSNLTNQKGIEPMKYKLNIYSMLTFELPMKALIVSILTLMVLPIHAAEQTANTETKETAADIQEAAMSSAAAVLNVGYEPEVVVAEIPAEVKAAVEMKLLSKIAMTKIEIDPEAAQVFSAPIYKVEPVLNHIAVIDGKVLDLNYHGSAAILSGYQKLINDDFVLDSVEKAKLLGVAFQHEFPYKLGEEFKQPVKLDKGWLLIRNKFFKNHSGLVFTTDEKGAITLVEYVLKINPEDYSYQAPTDITL